jgi:hypothetical protein
MSELNDFFQKEAQECRRLAAQARTKRDREYWMSLAERWQNMFRAPQPDEGATGLAGLH